MKKLSLVFLLTILVFSSTLLQAQYVIKADLFKQHERADTILEFPHWGDPEDDSTLITFTTDSLLIFDNKEKETFKLDSLLNKSFGADLNDGDKWVGVKWLATDKMGMQTMIVIQKFDSETIMITITYGNVEYRYQCRPLKNSNKSKEQRI